MNKLTASLGSLFVLGFLLTACSGSSTPPNPSEPEDLASSSLDMTYVKMDNILIVL